MMKNLMKILALVLCMMFVFPSALAQEAAYKIGQPTNEAFLNAFASGKLVTAKINLDLDMNGEALGMTAEEAQELETVLAALKQADLTVGAGLTDQGVRFALEAALTDAQGGNPVSVNALADLTLDGVAVESDVIPGKRLTANWETILALCGVPQEEIDMLMSIKALDPEEVLELLEEAIETAIAELEPMIEMAAQLAMPYAETVIEFAQTLPVEIRENLSEEGYPPTAAEISVTVTAKDAGTLIAKLCDQLDADATLKVMLNALLEQADAGVTVEEIIAEASAAAAQMTDTESPVILYLGMNEDGVPMYAEVCIVDGATQESIYGGLFLYQDADGVWNFEVIGGTYDAEDNPKEVAYLTAAYLGDSADQNVYAAAVEAAAYAGETPLMQVTYAVESARAQDSELAAYDMQAEVRVYVEDGAEGVGVVAKSAVHQELTAAGGEKAIGSSMNEIYVGEQMTSETSSFEQIVEPTADGGVTGYTKVTQSMNASGIDNLTMNVAYASEAIDMAASQALEQVALETATENEMNELLMQAMSVLTEQKLPVVMNNLPAEVTEMILSAM
ncbi:MAG: hypothetical protein IKV90_01895 [Clostridia bacterium]|nr:hypothetical protein [Clostridia bacterium]